MSNDSDNDKIIFFDKYQSECILCDNPISIYAFGSCSHHICFECSSKMRVICDQKYCPVCRCNLDKVYFSRSLCKRDDLPTDVEFNKDGICFLGDDIKAFFNELFECNCKLCAKQFLQFNELCDHMTREHRRLYCTICVNFLKLFPKERRFYTREEFAHHSISGDADDASFTGHPLCVFCKKRFFDKDDLYRHSTVDHYYCSFCSVNGKITFYKEYEELRNHFRANHFLCEHEACRNLELSSHVFQSEIELKTHVLEMHTGSSKQAKRQAGMIPSDIIFDYSYNQMNRSNNNSSALKDSKSTDDHAVNSKQSEMCELNEENFPGLSSTVSHANPSEVAEKSKVTYANYVKEWMSNKLPECIDNASSQSFHTNSDKLKNVADSNANRTQSKPHDTGITYRLAATTHKAFDLDSTQFPTLPQTAKLFFDDQKRQPVAVTNNRTHQRSSYKTESHGSALTLKNVNRPDKINFKTETNVSLTKSDFPELSRKVTLKEASVSSKSPIKAGCLSLKAVGKSLTMNKGDTHSPTTRTSKTIQPIYADEDISMQRTNSINSSALSSSSSSSSSTFKHFSISKDKDDTSSNQAVNTNDMNQFPLLNNNPVNIAEPITNWRVQENSPQVCTSAVERKASSSKPSNDRTDSTIFNNCDFIPPSNYDRRKVMLACKIRDCVGDNELMFCSFKKSFRQYCDNKLNVVKFYNSLCDIVGAKFLTKFVYELITLLPDIEKQKELYDTVRSLLQPLSTKEKKKQQSKYFQWGVEPLQKCSICGQMVEGQNDLAYHYNQHDILSLGGS